MLIGLGLAVTKAGIVPFAPDASVALDFQNNRFRLGINGAMASSFLGLTGATFANSTGGYGIDASGNLISFPANTPRITNQGILIEGASTNLFLNSFAPATQTITLGATGSYTLGLWGSGSATIAAGTATITGAGAATASSSVTINCTVAGTVTVTISGSPTAVQLEAGAFRSSPIPTTSAAATRSADVASVGGLSLPMSAVTLAGQGYPPGVALGVTVRLASITDGTNDLLTIGYDTSGASDAVSGSGLTLTNIGGIGNPARVAAALNGTTARASGNGVATMGISGTYSGAPAATALRLGDITAGGRILNGYLQQVRIYPFAATDAQLQSISAGSF